MIHADLARALGNLEGKLDSVLREIDGINRRLTENTASLNKRIEEIDTRTTAVEATISRIRGIVATVGVVAGLFSSLVSQFIRQLFFRDGGT